MTSRLVHGLANDAVHLPSDGRIVVFGGGADETLHALSPERVQVVQPVYPDHHAVKRAGFEAVLRPEGRFGAALVRVPRARARALGWIADAARITDGPILVDGAKSDGVEGLLKVLRGRAVVSAPVSKAHGKLFAVTEWDDLSDWIARPATIDGFETRPGVFSADGIDRGSRLLADAMPGLSGRVADLGAGWGYLASRVLESAAVETLDLVEADAVALDCARVNVADPRAAFHWADVSTFKAAPYDAIVCNPPFHTGRAGDPGLGRAFISRAADLLDRNGKLWLVANRHLPYEAALAATFSEVVDKGGDASFKLYLATRPRRQKHR